MTKIAIIGGGAAGMYASVFLAEKGHEVHVFEKNEKLGKKLFITGKGRCNVTNDCDEETFFSSVITNSKFLYLCHLRLGEASPYNYRYANRRDYVPL